MDQRINRLEEKLDTKLDAIVDKLHSIDVTLVRNTQSLEIHEKRTDIAEQKLDAYEVRLDKIDSHNKTVTFIFLKVIPAAAGVIAFLYKMGWLAKLSSF